MREKTIKLYQYSELSDTAKERARQWFLESDRFDYEWDCLKDDAEAIGLNLTEWDYGRYAKGDFLEDACHCAVQIIKNHGDVCETYKTAEKFSSDRDKLIEMAPRNEDGELDNEYALDQALDVLEREFLASILEDYRVNADKQYDYVQSEEYIAEMMEANEYEFTEDGRRA